MSRRTRLVLLALGVTLALAGGGLLLRRVLGTAPAPEGERPASAAPPAGVPLADGFDFPVAAPSGRGFLLRKGFGTEGHLGEDWDGGGFDSDLGQPIYAVAAGRVSFAADVGGTWGRIVRVIHYYRDRRGELRAVESLYAHLERIDAREGELVRRGEPLGTLGNCDGVYPAHLHFELRARPGLPLGPGYAADTDGWLPPSEFIRRHRRD